MGHQLQSLISITDERGLYLEVSPSGGKYWRFKYRINGKEKRLSLGVYPDVSLKLARDRRDNSRKQVAQGIDPSETRKAEKIAQAGLESFEFVARDWHGKYKINWSDSHSKRTLARLENDVFPWIGPTSADEIIRQQGR